MLDRKEFERAQRRALRFFAKARIALTPEEKKSIEVADFGLGDLAHTGLEVIVYINTQRYCAKEIVMFPLQTCPEHYHPDVNGEPGKQETFRCRWGIVYMYVPGEQSQKPHCAPPPGKEKYYTVHQEILLKPGQQCTLHRGTLHWFQAGVKGAVVSEFSSRSTDENDVFTDPSIERKTRIKP
jgi:D-lyxose ketol-isomerase